jgi:hypothetical protein
MKPFKIRNCRKSKRNISPVRQISEILFKSRTVKGTNHILTVLQTLKSYETAGIGNFEIRAQLNKLLRLEHFRECLAKSEPLGL